MITNPMLVEGLCLEPVQSLYFACTVKQNCYFSKVLGKLAAHQKVS